MKKIHLFGYTVIGLLAVFMAIYTVWDFAPSDVLDVTNTPVPVRPKEINPEATIILSPHICKNISGGATIHRMLISSTTKIQLSDSYNNLPKGCRTLEIAVIIPAFVPNGDYYIQYNISYQVNPITIDHEQWVSQDFAVKHAAAQDSVLISPKS